MYCLWLLGDKAVVVPSTSAEGYEASQDVLKIVCADIALRHTPRSTVLWTLLYTMATVPACVQEDVLQPRW